MLSGSARIAGIIGWPVNHSLSPRLHNYWLAQHGIDGAYIPMPVKPDDLASIMQALPKMGIAGVNLTLPHKELVLPMLDRIDETAKAVGAVNTVIVTSGGRLHGTNTDAYGFAENIREYLPKRKYKAVMYGAGGAAKAVAYALGSIGFNEIVVTNRTHEKASALASLFSTVTTVPWESRNAILEDADLLVNATSLGMSGKEPLDIDLAFLPAHALVTDIVYAPLVTPLLSKAKTRGNPTIDGLGMLLHQAVPGFEAWFGLKPQVTAELRRYITG